MHKLKIISFLAVTAIFGGCATTGMFTETGESFIKSVTEPGTATSGVSEIRKGTACTHNYLGIYSGGDGSIAAAKKNGGINKVASVDKEIFAILPFYGSVCTVVRGE